MKALSRAVFTSIPDAILVADAHGRYVDANPAAATMLGYTRAELLALHVGDIVAPAGRWTAAGYARFTERDSWEGELEVRRKDGTLIPVEVRARAVANSAGSLYVAALRDITLRRQADTALADRLAREQAARAAAQEAVQVHDQFFTVALHELKNPLTTIIGNAELLQQRLARSAQLSARDAEPLSVIAGQAGQLDMLITTLFDVSRMTMGQFRIQPVLLDLDALLWRLVVAMRPAAPSHAISFVGTEVPLLCNADAVQLEEAIQNLIQNAIKYSPPEQPISVRVARCGEMAEIEVRDQGIGIPQAAQSQIFDRFYRASNVNSQRIGGLGIGLYIVKEIVSQHGGSIAVTSEEGHGSSFTISLPLAASAAPDL